MVKRAIRCSSFPRDKCNVHLKISKGGHSVPISHFRYNDLTKLKKQPALQLTINRAREKNSLLE
jgi:hypothetical protein